MPALSLPRAFVVPGVVVALATACAGFPDGASQANVVLANEYPPDTSLVIYGLDPNFGAPAWRAVVGIEVFDRVGGSKR